MINKHFVNSRLVVLGSASAGASSARVEYLQVALTGSKYMKKCIPSRLIQRKQHGRIKNRSTQLGQHYLRP